MRERSSKPEIPRRTLYRALCLSTVSTALSSNSLSLPMRPCISGGTPDSSVIQFCAAARNTRAQRAVPSCAVDAQDTKWTAAEHAA